MPRLRRVSPDTPGWTRRRAGRGFIYLDETGSRLDDEAVAATVRTTPVASPGENVSAYREAHATYRELYPALTPFFHRD